MSGLMGIYGFCGFQWEDKNGEHTCSRPMHEYGDDHECDCGSFCSNEDPNPKRQGMPHRPGGMNFRLEGFSRHEALMVSGGVRRYHTHPYVIGHQTVAEHTFRAMALMASLWPEHTHAALLALLCHDGAEAEVGDVPSPAKWAYPALGEALKEAEASCLSRLQLPDGGNLTAEEALWVKVCDWLEGAFFCFDQRRLGNAGVDVMFVAYVNALYNIPDLPEAARQETQRLAVAYSLAPMIPTLSR